MARKLERDERTRSNAGTLGEDPPDVRPRGLRESLISRRDCVRTGLATAGALTGLGVLGSASADSDITTITLDSGEQRAYTIDDGEIFENVLIDQTAAGAMFSLRVAEGADDWIIRDVGWKGMAPAGNRDYTFLIHVRGDGVIENVFIDQRNHDGGEGSDVGGIWTYSDSHHGHIECRHNFIAGCGNNASYTSGDGWSHNDATGTIEHYRSYHRDNTVSNFRPGNPGSTVRECVSVIHDPAGTRGSYPSSDSQLSRAIWAWHNEDLRMESCAIWHDPRDVQPAQPFWATWRDGSRTSGGDRAELHVVDCDINSSWEETGESLVPSSHGSSGSRRVEIDGLGHEPSVTVLGDGIPLSAEMAARGERELPPRLGTAPSGGHADAPPSPWSYDAASGVHTELPYELVVEHVEPGAEVTYEVEVEGDLEEGEWEHNAHVDGQLAHGRIGPMQGLDNLYFDGQIVRFDVENADHAQYFFADAQEREILEEVKPDNFPRAPGEDETEAPSRDLSLERSPVTRTSLTRTPANGEMIDPRTDLPERVVGTEDASLETTDAETRAGPLNALAGVAGLIAAGYGVIRHLDTEY